MSINPFDWLAWLSKYGLIDILFGIGIIGYISRALKKKKIVEIEGLEISPVFKINNRYFEIEVRNLSKETVYLYRSYFTRGSWAKFVEENPKTIWNSFMNFLFTKWRNQFPPINKSEIINNKGEIVLSLRNKRGKLLKPPFLEPRRSAYYRIRLKGEKRIINIVNLPCVGQIGKLTIYIIHGTTPYILETQV